MKNLETMTEEECYHELYKIHMRAVEKARREEREKAAQEKATMILNMFNGGISVEQIAFCSELSVDEVETILKQDQE